MAAIQGRITINEIVFLEVDGDPSAGAGTPAPTGSVASIDNGGGIYWKTGAADTAWSLASSINGFNQVVTVAAETSTTSNSVWSNKATLTTPSGLPLGNYMLSASFKTRQTSLLTGTGVDFRIQQAAVTIADATYYLQTGTDQPREDFRLYLPAISGAIAFTFDFKVSTGLVATAFCSNVVFTLARWPG